MIRGCRMAGSTGCLVTLALFSLGCRGPGDGAPTLHLTSDTLWVGQPVASRIPSLADTVVLSSVRDLKMLGDTLVVLDGLQRVTLFDTDLEAIRSFGRSGRGPGELEGCWGLAVRGDTLLVDDPGNSRVTFLSTTGALVRTLPLEGLTGRSLAPMPDGGYVVAAPDSSWYLRRVALDGAASGWAERPPRVAKTSRAAPPDPSPFVKDLVTIGPTGIIWVLDGETLSLRSYDVSGTLVEDLELPARLRATLLEGTGVRRETFAGRPTIAYRPAVRDLEMDARGRLLVELLPHETDPGLLALLADPADRSLTEIRARDPDVAKEIGSASATVLARTSLFAGGWQGELWRFELGGEVR